MVERKDVEIRIVCDISEVKYIQNKIADNIKSFDVFDINNKKPNKKKTVVYGYTEEELDEIFSEEEFKDLIPKQTKTPKRKH